MRASILTPKPFLALLDSVYGMYRRKFTLIFWISALLFLVPLLYMQILTMRYFGSKDMFGRIGDYLTLLQGGNLLATAMANLREMSTATLPITVMYLIVFPLSYAAFINAIHLNIIGKSAGFRDAFKIGWRAIGNVYLGFFLIAMVIAVLISPFVILLAMAAGTIDITTLICSGCLVGSATFVFIVSFMITFCFYFQCIVIEKNNPVTALGRCIKLIRGNWWRALTLLLLVTLVNNVIQMISETSFSGFDLLLKWWSPNLEILGKAIFAAGLTIVQVFLAPVVIITQTMLFYDVKVRHEAFDVELMINRFESPV